MQTSIIIKKNNQFHLNIVLGILFLLVSCKEKIDQHATLTSVDDTVSDQFEKYNKDTLVVEGKSIVFYSISQSEYDDYSNDTKTGLDEVLSDFDYYANQVIDNFQSKNYQFSKTANRFIKFKMNDGSSKVFDRMDKKEHFVGRIYSDGKYLKNHQGVATDVDILIEFETFNSL